MTVKRLFIEKHVCIYICLRKSNSTLIAFLIHPKGFYNQTLGKITLARIRSPESGCDCYGEDVIATKGNRDSAKVYGKYNGMTPRQSEGQKLGRFPANLIHDGADEVLASAILDIVRS